MEKKKIIILGILMLIFLLITTLVLYLNGKENIEEPNSAPTQNGYTTVEKVDNYKEFFTIQNTLNDISNASINTSYIVKEIYLSNISNTKYYFINSCKLGGNVAYEKNVYFVLILNTNSNSYQLNKISEVNDLESYASNYDIKQVNISSDKKIKTIQITTENILTSYIEYFKQMLILDQKTAYDLLDNNMKKQYSSYEEFKNFSNAIYNKLSSKVFAYEKKEDDEINKYYIEDDNRNKIEIYENSVMDFKISY